MNSASIKQDKERAKALLMALLDKQSTTNIHATSRTIPIAAQLKRGAGGN